MARGSVIPTATLPDGTTELSASQTDEAGNVSESTFSSITIDLSPPAAPVIDALDPANSATPRITGTGDINATVTVLADLASDLNGVDGTPETSIGTAIVQSDGTWSVVSTQTLPEGTTNLSATQVDSSGNESASSVVASIKVNTTSPSVPLFNALPVSNDTTPTFTGTGEENATVTILIDDNGSGIPDTVLGTTVVNGGNWSFGPVAALSDGIYAIVIYQTDPAGNISGSKSASVTIDTTPPVAPIFDALAATTITTPKITGTGEVGATVTVLADLATDLNGVDGIPETDNWCCCC